MTIAHLTDDEIALQLGAYAMRDITVTLYQFDELPDDKARVECVALTLAKVQS